MIVNISILLIIEGNIYIQSYLKEKSKLSLFSQKYFEKIDFGHLFLSKIEKSKILLPKTC